MQILINGESHRLKTPLTLDELIAQLALDPRAVAIERNQEIVPKSAYANTALVEGDALEIVQFIGGG